MVNSLAQFDPLEYFGHLVLAVRGHENGDRLSYHLRRGIAVDTLGGGVPARNSAIKPLADDGVVARLHDRRQLVERIHHVARTLFLTRLLWARRLARRGARFYDLRMWKLDRLRTGIRDRHEDNLRVSDEVDDRRQKSEIRINH